LDQDARRGFVVFFRQAAEAGAAAAGVHELTLTKVEKSKRRTVTVD
jgi:hypothetical protein